MTAPPGTAPTDPDAVLPPQAPQGAPVWVKVLASAATHFLAFASKFGASDEAAPAGKQKDTEQTVETSPLARLLAFRGRYNLVEIRRVHAEWQQDGKAYPEADALRIYADIILENNLPGILETFDQITGPAIEQRIREEFCSLIEYAIDPPRGVAAPESLHEKTKALAKCLAEASRDSSFILRKREDGQEIAFPPVYMASVDVPPGSPGAFVLNLPAAPGQPSPMNTGG